MSSSPARSPPVSSMWATLQKENRLPKSAVLSSCESELQELMRQIDLMVHSKKADWEREKHQLLARCKVLEQEQVIQKATMQDRNTEVGELRTQVETIEKQRRDMAAEYEKQLGNLRNEVARLKHEYERLQKKYSRHHKEVQRDRTKSSTQLDDYASEVNRLNAKLEEQRQKARESEQNKRSLHKQLDTAEAQRKTLAEKILFLQQQATSYQGELDKRSELLGSTEMSLHNQISQLEGQLHRARDSINTQDTQMSRLKSSLDDALATQRSALPDKERLEKELHKAQQAVRQSEEGRQELSEKLSLSEDEMKSVKEQSSQLQQQNTQLLSQLADRDGTIRKLQEGKKGGDNSRIQELQELLQESRTENRKAKKNEKYLREEINEQRQQIDSLELTLHTSQQSDNSQLTQQLLQLREQMEQLKTTYETDLGEARASSSQMSTQLQHKARSLSTLQAQAADMQHALTDREEAEERRQAELTVANAQLEALRLENRHLRRAALGKSDTDAADTIPDVAAAETHLKDLQAAYTQSINTLEKQNARLKSDRQQQQQQIHGLQQQSDQQVQQARTQSHRQLEQARQHDQRCMREVEERADSRVRAVEERLKATVAEYEARLQQLQNNMEDMEGAMDSHSSAMKRVVMENAVMSNFVDGVDTIVQQQPAHHSATRISPSMGFDAISPRPLSPDSFLNEDYLVDSADLATAQFLAEQTERTRDLERKLNVHIEDLKASTDATIRKYTRQS